MIIKIIFFISDTAGMEVFIDFTEPWQCHLFQKQSSSQDGGDGADEEEESGDEADLSKYDLWGSDEEKGTSSKQG